MSLCLEVDDGLAEGRDQGVCADAGKDTVAEQAQSSPEHKCARVSDSLGIYDSPTSRLCIKSFPSKRSCSKLLDGGEVRKWGRKREFWRQLRLNIKAIATRTSSQHQQSSILSIAAVHHLNRKSAAGAGSRSGTYSPSLLLLCSIMLLPHRQSMEGESYHEFPIVSKTQYRMAGSNEMRAMPRYNTHPTDSTRSC